MKRFAGDCSNSGRPHSNRFSTRTTTVLLGVSLIFGGAGRLHAAPQDSDEMNANRTVLFIGDSNTEYGFITGALKDILADEFGDFGTGYYPFSIYATVGSGRVWGWQGDMEGLKLSIDTVQWNLADAIGLVYEGKYNVTRKDAPTWSPSTHWIESREDGASMSAEFTGSGFDLYWTAAENGGTFEILVDDEVVQSVNTQGMPKTKRTSITNLDPSQKHTAVMRQTSGKVILQGMDVMRPVDGESKRAVVHTWANSGAAAIDFVNIHEEVFSSALQLINPACIVILLGTNDAIEEVSESDFQENMITITERINAALPTPRILIASCINIKFDAWDTYGGQYLETSYPTIAQEVNAEYWNLHDWFGPYQENENDGFMKDKAHVNDKGGEKIAPQLWLELQNRFGIIGVRPGSQVSGSVITALRTHSFISGLSGEKSPARTLDLLGRKRGSGHIPSISIIQTNSQD